MYGLVSYATEIIGGDSWETTLQEKIFTPLGMDKTSFSHVADMSRADIAVPYLREPENGNWKSVSTKLHRLSTVAAVANSVAINRLIPFTLYNTCFVYSIIRFIHLIFLYVVNGAVWEVLGQCYLQPMTCQSGSSLT